jgi:hypothetical protein
MANAWYLVTLKGVIQEEESLFYEVILLVIVTKEVHMNVCLILNGYGCRGVWVYKCKALWMVIKQEELLIIDLILILI